MAIEFEEFKNEHLTELIGFLSSGYWPFHSIPKIPVEKLNQLYENGYFNGDGRRTFWIIDKTDNLKAGVIRLFDLGTGFEDDETPLFDIKIKEEFRGNGIGKKALIWMTDLVFSNYPNKLRFEATTRIDNIAMRKVFESCGFVKEAHYRQAWPDKDGNRYDCVGYAILREDWKNNTRTVVEWKK